MKNKFSSLKTNIFINIINININLRYLKYFLSSLSSINLAVTRKKQVGFYFLVFKQDQVPFWQMGYTEQSVLIWRQMVFTLFKPLAKSCFKRET